MRHPGRKRWLVSALMTLLAVLCVAPKSHAFPSLVSHGYTTCVTCHYSPSGGGLLNSYGKYIAGELFGAFNDSESALPWLTKPEEDRIFAAGIFARGAQTYFNSPYLKRGTFERMQLDVEAGVSIEKFFTFVAAGFRGSSARDGQNETDVKVRSYYTGFRDLNYVVRAGRFFPEFGIRHPHHNIPTRKGLYWNAGDEPYVAQAAWMTPTFDLSLSYLSGARETQLDKKSGFTETLTYKTAFTRSGISRLDMQGDSGHTNATSFFTQIGYFGKGYTLAEFAVKKDRVPAGVWSERHLAYLESGWELARGLIPYLGYELTENLRTDSRTSVYPLGVRFYPVTHAEVVVEYGFVETTVSRKVTRGEAAFAMFNLYF